LNFHLPSIYPITDTHLSGISHAEQVERLIRGGATLIQLREKDASPADFYQTSEAVIRTARDRGVKIIINDRVDIALAVRADGVHLGQDDLPPGAARAILGDDAIIGFSTHTLDQAIAAIKLPVDYIAFGPIFDTNTKRDHDAVVGLDGLKHVRDAIGDFPMVAIGGIKPQNLRSVLDAGADSVAMIGAIVADAAAIEQRMTDLLELSKP
jgi:thiamine-phosphate pyrophosphorylase